MDANTLGFQEIKVSLQKPEFLTYHMLMEVPRELYEEVLANYHGDIYQEEPVQDFVIQFLRWRGDNGIVGLVGMEEKGTSILIDAAVRYPYKTT